MEQESGSKGKHPVLGLLLKTAVAAGGVYLLRENSFSIFTLLLYSLVFWAIYLWPPFNNRKFLVSAFGLFALPILLPPAGAGLTWVILIIWTSAFVLLIGVKNLILLRRHGSYEAVHLLLVFGAGILYFLGVLPLISQIILFIIFFLLFREFYFVLAPHYPQRLALVGVAEALILTQIAWLLSFLSINFLAAASLLALASFTLHDLMLHHFQGTLSRQILLRTTTLFVILSLALLLLPR